MLLLSWLLCKQSLGSRSLRYGCIQCKHNMTRFLCSLLRQCISLLTVSMHDCMANGLHGTEGKVFSSLQSSCRQGHLWHKERLPPAMQTSLKPSSAKELSSGTL